MGVLALILTILMLLHVAWEWFKLLKPPLKPVPAKKQRFITSRVLNGSDEVRNPEQMMAILVLSERARAVN